MGTATAGKPAREPQEQSTEPLRRATPAAQSVPGAWTRPGSLDVPVATIVSLMLVAWAWTQRFEGEIVPEEGAGYWLGIAGSLMMLTLLLYPLRKKLRSLRMFGQVRHWFRAHMLLGVFGPALIVLHSNFHIGSLNGGVALTAMLVVAGSGFIGRFLYTHLHRGLYGQKAQLREYLDEAGAFRAAIQAQGAVSPEAFSALEAFERDRLALRDGFFLRLWRATTSGIAGRRVKSRVLAHIRDALDARGGRSGMSAKEKRHAVKDAAAWLDRYRHAIADAEALSVFERLFSAWHMLHLPLFVILVFAAIAHVIAVHLY